MFKDLNKISNAEMELLQKAPLLVCILIAGADNKIDKKEMKEATGLAEMKKGKIKGEMIEFFKVVTEDFEDKLKIILQGFPSQSTERNPLLIKELTQLNSILPKVNKTFAYDYYKCLRFVAKRIAESSGGVFGINAVDDDEEKLLHLPMIKDPSVS